jgi:hypothetical protein
VLCCAVLIICAVLSREAVRSDQASHVDDPRVSAMDFGRDSSSQVSSHSSLPDAQDTRFRSHSDRRKPSEQHTHSSSGSGSGSGSGSTINKNNDDVTKKSSKLFNNISFDEINKMIEERVQQVCIMCTCYVCMSVTTIATTVTAVVVVHKYCL